MITLEEFDGLNEEIVTAVSELFDWIESHSMEHDYTLLLADGEYWGHFPDHYNPYVIDSKVGVYKDRSRRNFLNRFLQTFYSFPNGEKSVEDDEYRITMELMIYTHAWESKSFLTQLYRLAVIADGKSYPWRVEVPEMSRHIFIREEIRNVLKEKKLKIASVISKGFHTSLRNAFAHSEYQIEMGQKIIRLDTYKGAKWDIDRISFDDWTKRFIYTILLSYYLINEKAQRREAYGKAQPKRLIIHPISSQRHFTARYIYYNVDFNTFGFNER